MTFSEDRIPAAGIEVAIGELERDLASHGLQCTVSWAAGDDGEATVTMTCDIPREPRPLLLLAGVVGALLFTIWPFHPGERLFGTLAWVGGAMAVGAYVLSLRKTRAGMAYEALQKLARRQRQ